MLVFACVCESGPGVGWNGMEEAHCIYLSGDKREKKGCSRSEGWQWGTRKAHEARWMKGWSRKRGRQWQTKGWRPRGGARQEGRNKEPIREMEKGGWIDS